MSDVTYKDVWNTLSKIDCSNNIDTVKFGDTKLSYLSWAWAWAMLMDNYPEAQVKYYENKETGVPYVQMPDGTVEVRCRVSIADGVWREMWLPVMDNRNNAIPNPNARQVSDSKMRCLVKCLAMFGLGHHIYAGEDIPKKTNIEQENISDKPKPKAKKEEWVKPEVKTMTLDEVAEKAPHLLELQEKLKDFQTGLDEFTDYDKCKEYVAEQTKWIKELDEQQQNFARQLIRKTYAKIKGENNEQ
tara:strand:- start:662 stop:1393 length:732 start_codon:yes stop_codon:yes gene_type:complete